MKILIVVDYQKDFMSFGKLPVPGAEEVKDFIQDTMKSSKYDFIICTKDWHPINHISFAKSNGVDEFTEIDTSYGKQMMWPIHCVGGSNGSDLYLNDIEALNKVNAVLHKGYRSDLEAYSVFTWSDGSKTPAYDMVNNLYPTQIDIVGVAGDYCVKNTAIDSLKLCNNVNILRDGVKCISTELDDIKEFLALGINIIYLHCVKSVETLIFEIEVDGLKT